MSKILVFKAKTQAIALNHIRGINDYFRWYSYNSTLSTEISSKLGFNAFCVAIEVDGLETNNLVAAKLYTIGNSDECHLVGIMDDPTDEIEIASQKVIKDFYARGDFGDKSAPKKAVQVANDTSKPFNWDPEIWSFE